MKEIVGAIINGGTVTNSVAAIRVACERGTVDRFLDRRHMEFMAACDLGQNWRIMAEGPTLFCVDDNGQPCAP